jgi:hypothetical protein
MPRSEYSNDLKSRIHHLALLGFTAKETSIILAIPESTVYQVLALFIYLILLLFFIRFIVLEGQSLCYT